MSTPSAPAPSSDAGAAKAGFRHSVRALRHRNFAVFWAGALISNSGSWVQNATVPYVLYQLTRSEAWVGLATFAQFIPGVVFGPLGGSLADRLDRRRFLILTQALLGGAAVALWLLWAAGLRSPVAILLLVAATGVLSGLNIPTWQAFVPALVPREDLLSAITLNSLQFNAARAIGSGLAGLVLYKLGPANAFLLNAVSYLVVVGALLLLQLPTATARRPAEGGVMRQFAEAVRYARVRPGISLGIVMALLIAFLGNPIVQFAVVFAESVYHVGKLQYGLLAAAMGLGALVSAPLVSGWDTVVARGTVVRWTLPLYGLSVTIFGLSNGFVIGFVALIAAGAAFLAVISATNTAVQIIVADSMRGRVLACRIMSFTLAYSFGGLIQGQVAEWVGPRVTVASAGALLLAAGLYLAWGRPGLLEHLDDAPDVDPDVADEPSAQPSSA
ncbi:MAG: MFS transporter [Acidimicrobiales bacterium]|nr:MFS transporter [Acidimicrobiales bacterium]